jgi:hypothetical protein
MVFTVPVRYFVHGTDIWETEITISGSVRKDLYVILRVGVTGRGIPRLHLLQ